MPLSLTLLAAGGLPPLARDLAICTVAAAGFAALFSQLRLPHALGFILAGVTVGPALCGLVGDPEEIKVIAELGIVLLLFLLGLELDLASLRGRARQLWAVGLLQVPLTFALAAGLFIGADSMMRLGIGRTELVYLALLVSFSSTLVVVNELERTQQLRSRVAGLCVGVLIAQDLWALMVLTLQSSSGAGEVGALVSAAVGTIVVAALAFGPGRRLAAVVLSRSPGGSTGLVIVALGWCLGWALFAEELDVLSRTLKLPIPMSCTAGMGAFVAGVALGDTPRGRALAQGVVGTRDLFIAMFFVSLGMSLPWPIDPRTLALTGMVVGALLLSRVVVMWPLLRCSVEATSARRATATMTQISEFALVAVYVGYETGHVGASMVELSVVAFALTAVASPLMSRFGARAGPARAGASEPRTSEPGARAAVGWSRDRGGLGVASACEQG